MAKRLEGKRVLVTQATDYMGPAIATLFEAEGAAVEKAEGALLGEAADLGD